LGQRAPGHGRQAQVGRLLQRAVGQRLHLQRRELDLVGDERHAAVQRRELRRAVVAHAKGQHLAGPLQLHKGLGHFIGVAQHVGAVDEQQLDAVGAQHVLITRSRHNAFGHPHPQVLARYQAAGVEVHDTALQGALHLRLGEHAAPHGLRREPRFWREK
jgi:hypothetical protein